MRTRVGLPTRVTHFMTGPEFLLYSSNHGLRKHAVIIAYPRPARASALPLRTMLSSALRASADVYFVRHVRPHDNVTAA